jgi:uncharacterized protein
MNLTTHHLDVDSDSSLATDVYLPSTSGSHPVVLVRTPYNRKGLALTAETFVDRGYAFVTQDCRGKFESVGHFIPLLEAVDGQATLDWIANQPWCNGRIGMWGRSYLGIVQIPAAAGQHEALKCIAPSVAPGSFFKDWLRYDGCFALANAVRWGVSHASFSGQPEKLDEIDWEALHNLDGPEAIADAVGFVTPMLKAWAQNDVAEAFWDQFDQEPLHDRITVPGMHAGGWFDHLTRGQFNAYRNIRDRGATGAARSGQRLFIGPWGHSTISAADHRLYGEWDFGEATNVSVLDHELRFLDLYLRDIDDGISSEPPVRVFEMGTNQWIDLDDWPPSDAKSVSLHLDDGGRLSDHPGSGSQRYVSDPSDPVPTQGGPIYWGLLNKAGPVDQADIIRRADTLYYRTEPLDSELQVCGPISFDVAVTCDQPDADLIAKLCVESADGDVHCLTLGSLRLRYRNGYRQIDPIVPGEILHVTLDLGHVSYRFAADSRIGLILCSSDFPRILPNTHTIDPPWSGVTPERATLTVVHDSSALRLFCLE